MSIKVVFSLIGCSPLLACASIAAEPEIPERGVTPGYLCDADALQYMVGKQATGQLGREALEKSGAKILRWIQPNTAVTMDYRTDRLNIAYDEKMMVDRINCG